MAEVFGVVAGAAGLVTALKELNKGLGVLREARRQLKDAPLALDSLTAELQFLTDLVRILIPREQAIKSRYPSGESILKHCVGSCQEVLTMLQELQTRHGEALTTKRRKSVSKLSTFRNWKEDVKALQDKIVGVKQNLTLISGLGTFQDVQVEELFVVTQTRKQHVISQTEVEQNPETRAVESPYTSVTLPNLTKEQSLEEFNLRYIRKRQINCFSKDCPCSCHLRHRESGSFWTFRYTPYELLRRPCDFKGCTGTDYGVGFNLDFSPLGLLWVAEVQLRVFAASGGMFIRPPLAVKRVVPRDSPGFRIIEDFFKPLRDFPIDPGVDEVGRMKEKLLNLSQTDPTFANHETPHGSTYLENFLRLGRFQITLGNLVALDVLKFMLEDLGLLKSAKLPQLLRLVISADNYYPIKSSDRGAVDILLDAGMDPGEADGLGEADELDHGIPARDALAYKCLTKYFYLSPGFKQMTPLHEAILFHQSHDVVSHWVKRCAPNERNAFGQTPLHLAVGQPDRVALLVNAGHDVNAMDVCGYAPLDYALYEARDELSAQIEETIAMLVEYGASWHLYQELFQRGVLWYSKNIAAAVCLIHALQTNGDDQTAQDLSSCTLRWAMQLRMEGLTDTPKLSRTHIEGSTGLDYLLTFLPSPFLPPIGDDTTDKSLLEYVTSEKQFRILGHHFDFSNHVNHTGQGSLSFLNPTEPVLEPFSLNSTMPGMMRTLIDRGVDVNSLDHWNHGPLYHTLAKAHHSLFENVYASYHAPILYAQLLAAVAVLLERGADWASADACRCSCCLSGCFPLSATGVIATDSFYPDCFVLPLYTIVYIQILWDYRSPFEARRALLMIVRKATHEELDMTHVCCSGGSNEHVDWKSPRSMAAEDIDDILEEEEEFTQLLDEEMDKLEHATCDELIDFWFSHIKARFDQWCAGNVSQEGLINRNPRSDIHGSGPLPQHSLTRETLDEFKAKQVAECTSYQIMAVCILCLEPSFFTPKSNGNPGSSHWYVRGYSQLLRLIKVLEIPKNAILKELEISLTAWKKNTKGTPNGCPLDGMPERFRQEMEDLESTNS